MTCTDQDNNTTIIYISIKESRRFVSTRGSDADPENRREQIIRHKGCAAFEAPYAIKEEVGDVHLFLPMPH